MYPQALRDFDSGDDLLMTLFRRCGYSIVLLLLLVVWHQYTLGIGTAVYAFWGFGLWVHSRIRRASLPSSPASS